MTIGLDDVVAAETALSHVDGEAGRLIIGGHDLEELAGRVAFEDVVAMLWSDLAPEVSADPRARLGEARARASGPNSRASSSATCVVVTCRSCVVTSAMP